MTSIKKVILEDTVTKYIGNLGFLGQGLLSNEIFSSKNKTWEFYVININQSKEKLDKYKNKAIVGEKSEFKENIFNFYILLRGAIEKIENNLLPKKDGITITEAVFSIGFFSTKISIDPKIIEDRKIYINNQIDYLVQTILNVENPALSSQIKAWFSSNLHLS